MQRERRGQQAFHAAVLAVALIISAALANVLGAERSAAAGKSAPAELTRVAAVTAAVMPQAMTPVLPEARLIAKPSAGALFLLVAAIAALLLGEALRFGWSAAARSGPSGVPTATLNAVRGRAPPSRTA